MAPTQAPLPFPPEPTLYHDPAARGFFALLTQQAGSATKQQQTYRVEQLPWILEKLNPAIDSWISQAEFAMPSRRVVHLLRISLCFVDLDTYHSPQLAGRKPEDLAKFLRMVCDDRGIPQPTLILFSGRGLQVKWLLDRPLPRKALIRWNVVQRTLVGALRDLEADPAARDASRVLRIERTTNTRTGEIVRVVDVLTANGEPVRYDFDRFALEVLPVERELWRQKSQAAESRRKQLRLISGGREENRGRRGFNVREWAWVCVDDLRVLARMRGWMQGGVPDGSRMLYLHWMMNFLLLSGATNSAEMYREAEALAREVMPKWTFSRSELGTLFRKARDYEAGVSVEIGGRKYPPLYTPSGAHMAELLSLSTEEQYQLRAFRSVEVRKDQDAARKRQERREAGAVARSKYLADSAERGGVVLSLRQEGKSIRQIAEIVGLGKSQVQRLLL